MSIKETLFTEFKGEPMPSNVTEFPSRAFELIEFIKSVEKESKIVGLYFDFDSHYISFVTSGERTQEEA